MIALAMMYHWMSYWQQTPAAKKQAPTAQQEQQGD